MKEESVFFLGAGFSKAINSQYPDLKALSDEIKKLYKKDENPIAIHFRNNIPKKYQKDIEYVLTYLSGNFPFKTDVQMSLDEALYKDITAKIANKFYNISDTQNMLENCDKIISYIWENQCPCITLNYDTLLESLLFKSLEDNNFQLPFDKYSIFYHYPINDFYKLGSIDVIDGGDWSKKHISKNELPNIIKLHGSINWYLTGFDNSAIVQYDDEANSSLSPFIIPPVLDKSVLYNNFTLKKCWHIAFESLKTAKRIFIYGFSFPKTDLAIKFLFQSALKENKNNPKIYIINTEEYRKNGLAECRKLFNPNSIIDDYCCENSLTKFNEEINSIT